MVSARKIARRSSKACRRLARHRRADRKALDDYNFYFKEEKVIQITTRKRSWLLDLFRKDY